MSITSLGGRKARPVGFDVAALAADTVLDLAAGPSEGVANGKQRLAGRGALEIHSHWCAHGNPRSIC